MLMRKLSSDTQRKVFLLIVFGHIVSEIKLQKSSFINTSVSKKAKRKNKNPK